MSNVSKIITLLIMGALGVLIIKNPSGFSADAVAGGGVLDNTLALESGSNYNGGSIATSVHGVGSFV